jgi:hypothetical protein
MATNQESLQASLRARSGSTKNLTFNGDWHAVFDADSIPAGMFNERLLNWINFRLSSSHPSLPMAQAAYAASKSVVRWSDITNVT